MQQRNRGANARRRMCGFSAAVALAASAALALTACGGSGHKADPTPSGSGQQAVNDGAGIPTKALSVAQAQAKLLNQQEVPGGASGYQAKRAGAQRLPMGRALSGLSGLNDECSASVRASQKQRASVLSGSEASVTLPKDASGTNREGKVTITIFTTRPDATLVSALGNVADTCSGTVSEPDSIAPVQRGLTGVAVSLGKTKVTVAAGDWGANHLLVETTNVDAEVAQQIADAQMAKLAAPTD